MRVLLGISSVLLSIFLIGQPSSNRLQSAKSKISLTQMLHSELGLKSTESLVQKSVVTSPFGNHYSFSHYVEGKEVLYSRVNYHLHHNQTTYIQNFLVEPTIVDFEEAYPYLLKTDEGLVSVFSNKIQHIERPKTSFIDKNGSVLFEQLDYKYYSDTTIHANVFEVNPINSANTVYGGLFIDNGDATNVALDDERKWNEVYARYSNDTFYLKSEFIKIVDNQASPTIDSVYYQIGNDSFSYTRNETLFETLNVYFHIQAMAEYINTIGFNSLTTQLEVDPHGFTGDNSWFSPNDFSLTFGEGGVDDGEDGEVIVHEYVHALSEKASLNTTVGTQRQSMEEGTCDYMCKAYSRSYNDHSPDKIFSWDGHNEFWSGFGINTNRMYPNDLANTKDGDRDIWSSALMCGHDALGRETMDSLVLMHLYYQGPNTTMTQMAEVIIDLDSMFFNQRNYTALKGCFANAGFIEYGANVNELDLPTYLLTNTLGFLNGTDNATLSLPSDMHISIYNSQGFQLENYFTDHLELAPMKFTKGLYIISIESENFIHSFKILR